MGDWGVRQGLHTFEARCQCESGEELGPARTGGPRLGRATDVRAGGAWDRVSKVGVQEKGTNVRV